MNFVVEHASDALQRRWVATRPARWALLHSPIRRGRRRVGSATVGRLFPRSSERLTLRLGGDRLIRLPYSDALAREIIYFGEFEAAETRELIARPPAGTVILDIGANVGYHSATIALARADLTVIAVEPVPGTVSQLRAATNGLANVKVAGIALGEEEGTLMMASPVDGAYASVSESGGVRVPAQTLDSFWHSLGRPSISLCKIDVEGFEPQVLRGGLACLGACKPALIIEAGSPKAREAVDAILIPLGYQSTHPRRFDPWNYLYLAK